MIPDSPAAPELRGALAPHLDEGPDAAMGWLVAAAAACFDDTVTAVQDLEDERSSWVLLCDPFETPAWALPWLAVHAGVPISGRSEADARAAIALPEGHRRGTLGAMVAVSERTLTGSREILVRERTAPAQPGVDLEDHLTFVTRGPETPDPAAFVAAARTQKPAGLIFHHVQVSGVSWDELDGTTWQDLTDDNASWTDLQNGILP